MHCEKADQWWKNLCDATTIKYTTALDGTVKGRGGGGWGGGGGGVETNLTGAWENRKLTGTLEEG